MSFRTSRQNTTDSKILDGPLVQPGQWVRNPEWMPMPATTSAQEQIDLLVAVYPESSYIAFTCTTSNLTSYTVDWGDGSAPVNVNHNVAAQYLYDYNAAGLTGPGTLPYKQAMIKVTPTSGGVNFDSVNLQVKNTTTNLQAYAQLILDLTVSMFGATLIIGGTTVPPRLMERCTILKHGLNVTTNLFQNCSALQSVPLFNTAAVTNMSVMFSGCSSLTSVPLFNTAAVTNMSSMFSGCSSLTSVPLFNTAAVTNMTSMFQNCSSLQSVPLFNTASVATMSNMFNSCSSLQSVPLFNTAAVTAMNSMFLSCSALQSVPLFNTALVATMASMFDSCSSLTSVPLFNTALVTSMGSMFRQCPSLITVPLFNTIAVTRFDVMFDGCSSLQSVPAFATNAVTGTTAFTTMFRSCSSLQEIPDMNFNRAAITTSASYTNTFGICPSLSRINLSAGNGPKFTFSVASAKLSAAALNQLYTSLPTVTGQTITVSGNVGIAGDDPTIATAKGWTVTGS